MCISDRLGVYRAYVDNRGTDRLPSLTSLDFGFLERERHVHSGERANLTFSTNANNSQSGRAIGVPDLTIAFRDHSRKSCNVNVTPHLCA